VGKRNAPYVAAAAAEALGRPIYPGLAAPRPPPGMTAAPIPLPFAPRGGHDGDGGGGGGGGGGQIGIAIAALSPAPPVRRHWRPACIRLGARAQGGADVFPPSPKKIRFSISERVCEREEERG